MLKTKNSFRKRENKYQSWPCPSHLDTAPRTPVFDHIIPKRCLNVLFESWPVNFFLSAHFLGQQQMPGTLFHLSHSPMPLRLFSFWYAHWCARMKPWFTKTSLSPLLYPCQQLDTGTDPGPSNLCELHWKEPSFLCSGTQWQQGSHGRLLMASDLLTCLLPAQVYNNH